MPFVIGRSAEYKHVTNALGEMLEGSYWVSSVHNLSENFIEDFKPYLDERMYNDQTIGAYDSVFVLDHILKKCPRDEDIDCLKRAIYEIDGVVASRKKVIEIDEKGDNVISPIVKQYVGGGFKEL